MATSVDLYAGDFFMFFETKPNTKFCGVTDIIKQLHFTNT